MPLQFGSASRALCALLLVVATSASTLAAPAGDAPAGTLDAIATANLARDRAVGAVVAVVADGDPLFFRAYGTMDVASGAPMRTDAIFGIGSITKQFTAAAILKLRDEGKLRFDDDLTKWLPDFDTHGHAVPLRRLLDHTSGIRDFTETSDFQDLVRNASFSRDAIYALIEGAPFQFPPGTAQVYNNSAYWLLHLVIEKASGMGYRQYIQSRLLEPLGMEDSGFCLDATQAPKRATGHHVRDGRVRRAPLNVTTWYLGSGALCSSAEDLVAWLQALHGGAVLSPASFAEMIEPATLVDGTRTRYAMGLQVGADSNGLEVIGHSGEIAGYGARANWYPDARLAVVVLVNNSGDVSASAMARDLAAAVLPVTRRGPRPFRGDGALLAGTYQGPARGGDMVATVTQAPQGIAISVDGRPARPLAWVEGRTFLHGPALLTFRGAGGNGGAATALHYDAGNGYYVLERLTAGRAALAQARVLVLRHWPWVLAGLVGLALLSLVAMWSRRRRAKARYA